MIDNSIEQPWPQDVLDAVARFKQGDLVERPPFVYSATPRHGIWKPSPRAGSPRLELRLKVWHDDPRWWAPGPACEDAIDWLIGEVERLREQEELALELGELLPRKQLTIDRLRVLLERLEWAGSVYYDDYDIEKVCPVCQEPSPDFGGGSHATDPPCWLAAELGTTKVAPSD